MLFPYPAEAVEDNWLHTCLFSIINSIHTSLDSNEDPAGWPDIVPDLHRENLRSRKGLKKRVEEYCKAVMPLSREAREKIITLLVDQNEIVRLLACDHNCGTVADLPQEVRAQVESLFEFGFKLLTDPGVRDIQYKIIYENSPGQVCPFCGCEYFDAPGAPREALDHYLPKEHYPFAAANLRNLVPMGHKCNSGYKHVEDVLKKRDGTRRRVLDPYGTLKFDLSLDESVPFSGADGMTPEWRLTFLPACEEAITWDEIFQIKNRYKRDVLDKSFRSWLDDFSNWCKLAGHDVSTSEKLIEALDKQITYFKGQKFRDRAFLKAAVMQMLKKQCEKGNDRLVRILQDLAS